VIVYQVNQGQTQGCDVFFRENKEKRPLVLLHDVRSFLTDIKRYIIANPQLGMVNKIQKICNSNSIADVGSSYLQ